QHLAVDLHSGLAKAVHQLVVGQSRLPRCSVDARDPETAHLALAAPAVAECVGQRVKDRLVGGPEEELLGESESLRAIEDRLMAPVRRDSALDSCHLASRRPAPGGRSCGPPWPPVACSRSSACASSTCARAGGSSTPRRASACRGASPGCVWRDPFASST